MGAVSEQPGRYRRSTSGLIASILVTLVAIGGFVALRELTRNDLEVEPEPVDYLSAVEFAQQEGAELVYPPSLPDGWIATSVEITPGEEPVWRLGVLTDQERFVGLRQDNDSLDDMLEAYVDEDVDELEPERLDSPVAPEWRVFEDEGGDVAFAAEVGDQVVLVYGSAGADDVRRFAESLTTEPRGGAAAG
jgi:hypothetical protein